MIKKIAYTFLAIGLFALLISAGRQLRYIGNADGLDTANVSGTMRTSRGLIVKDTFTTKPGDFFQLWRNSSKLAYMDSAARAFFPELLINTTTRTGDALIVNGVINAIGAAGVSIKITSNTAIRTDGTMYIDALNATNGELVYRYGATLAGQATFNNLGALIPDVVLQGARLQDNYTTNANTNETGIHFAQYENAGEDYAEFVSTHYDAGAFVDYAWMVLARQGKGVLIGQQYAIDTNYQLQVTGNVKITGKIQLGAIEIVTGTGTPEGAVTAPVGSMFTRSDGGASTTLYIKESGAGNTGWIAK